ncbi:MAG: cysteine synthase family protein [candidate division Zixibacteria bacterium]|nr:cysteine synthase family protein [candidate division Zixibacteria bacterium]
MADIKENILETIGKTPMVKINRLCPNPAVTIWAKLEWCNPLGSVKERVALAMVEAAVRDGRLTKNKIILESSSGNTGIGLAMVGAQKGYQVLITMSEGVSIERRRIIEALGAEILLTPARTGSDGAWDKADELYHSNPRKYCRLSQYRELSNVEAHYYGTAEEIWEQTGEKIDVLVVTLGTTGTAVGCGRRLKELNPKIRIISVEPQAGKHKQQGIRNISHSRIPEIWDASVVDERLVCKDEDAFLWARRLAKEEGLFGGISTGSAFWGAYVTAEKMASGHLVVIFPDNGLKYLSTELYRQI